jgi:tryptophan synthase beta chain
MERDGMFGAFGGFYVSELLIPALEQLERAWLDACADPAYAAELGELLRRWAGRPTPLCPAPRLSAELGFELLLKREDLLHGGAHKTNHAVGQALLARRMGKRRLIAETGAGQHGVATAMAAALFGLEAVIYMGEKDVARQAPNVRRMELFGARVVPVRAGSRSLKDAINEALRAWTERLADTFYVFGTVAGPHPYPALVRGLQRVIGDELRAELLRDRGRLPDAVYACVGGGSNAIGAFAAFLDDAAVALVGVEPAGRGLDSGAHGAALARGRPGVLHGAHSMLLQDADGQVLEAHSVSAGLDYPGVGPEHAALQASGRVRYTSATDAEALAAFAALARAEGILPALESSHALAAVCSERARWGADALVVLNLSGRGDKDLDHVAAELARARPAGAA